MSERVSVNIHDHVADVRLNRPDKHNALDAEMFRAITEAGESLLDNRRVRAVVLSGNGPSFCAGLDFQSFQGMSQRDSSAGGDAQELARAGSERITTRAQQLAYVWKQVPVPVIASLHGVSYGGGLQLALAADIRLAHPEAKLSIMEIRWGLIPDMTATQTLRDLVRLDIAKELMWSGRLVGADEASRLGLVTWVYDEPREAALALAAEIASKSPDAIRAGKQLLEAAWHADAAAGLALEARLQRSLIGSPNQTEAVKANFEKRGPQFED